MIIKGRNPEDRVNSVELPTLQGIKLTMRSARASGAGVDVIVGGATATVQKADLLNAVKFLAGECQNENSPAKQSQIDEIRLKPIQDFGVLLEIHRSHGAIDDARLGAGKWFDRRTLTDLERLPAEMQLPEGGKWVKLRPTSSEVGVVSRYINVEWPGAIE